MLFQPHHEMNQELWDSIPDTTNAEESIHWKLYCAVGKNMGLLEGLEGLFKFAQYLQDLSTATSVGIPNLLWPSRGLENPGSKNSSYKALPGKETTGEKACA